MGFHRSIAAMAEVGNDVIVDHVLSEPWRVARLPDGPATRGRAVRRWPCPLSAARNSRIVSGRAEIARPALPRTSTPSSMATADLRPGGRHAARRAPRECAENDQGLSFRTDRTRPPSSASAIVTCRGGDEPGDPRSGQIHDSAHEPRPRGLGRVSLGALSAVGESGRATPGHGTGGAEATGATRRPGGSRRRRVRMRRRCPQAPRPAAWRRTLETPGPSHVSGPSRCPPTRTEAPS